MKRSSIPTGLFIILLVSGCTLFNYNSRGEAFAACKNWENDKSVKIFIPEGSIKSKICELEIEARQVVGKQIKNPEPLKVYSEEVLVKEMKVVKYYR
jgi:hypothetical protein